MKVVVITGSPRKRGSSALLADNFIQGARAAGHEVYQFEAAFKKVSPCIGCEKCECGRLPCVIQDDMAELKPKLEEAEAVVFVSPVYYHDVSAQLKTVIDRFHGMEVELQGSHKKAVIIMSAASGNAGVADGALAVHRKTLRHLNWVDMGCLLALGCNTPNDLEKTTYPEQAYEMGRNL